ncbi:hypothetical protein ACIBL3_26175 [Kribbella sp. NPDC050124]|uniref:hypothetical protein n=1 Tax=Kribbella sp. NPDC050124 TaxID=3364114 RepID=UPI0037995938
MIKAIGTAAVLVAGILSPGTATAAESASCAIGVGSVTATGDHTSQGVVATLPPDTSGRDVFAPGFFTPGQVKLSSSAEVLGDGFGGISANGYVVIGDGLYRFGYHAANNTVNGGVTRIGGGWAGYVALEEAEYQGPTQAGISRRNTYALRSDGTLFRWTIVNGAWQNRVSAPGFAAVKSMVLISKAATYDTFLANTHGGALYTIHVPTTAPMKPVVKQVRRRTWQGFEALLAEKCGLHGTLLLGIDKDTQSGYLYAVGRATGTTTVIQSRGKVPVTFGDPVYFRWKDPGAPLNGE